MPWAGAWGTERDLRRCLLPRLRGGGTGLAPRLAARASAVLEEPVSFSSRSSSGQLAFPKSTLSLSRVFSVALSH